MHILAEYLTLSRFALALNDPCHLRMLLKCSSDVQLKGNSTRLCNDILWMKAIQLHSWSLTLWECEAMFFAGKIWAEGESQELVNPTL